MCGGKFNRNYHHCHRRYHHHYHHYHLHHYHQSIVHQKSSKLSNSHCATNPSVVILKNDCNNHLGEVDDDDDGDGGGGVGGIIRDNNLKIAIQTSKSMSNMVMANGCHHLEALSFTSKNDDENGGDDHCDESPPDSFDDDCKPPSHSSFSLSMSMIVIEPYTLTNEIETATNKMIVEDLQQRRQSKMESKQQS